MPEEAKPRAEGEQPPPDKVEGIPPRETPVTFSTHFASYNAGETAAFTPEEAARLDELGVTTASGGAAAAPVNVDIPVAAQEGDAMTCTMGNWENEPTAYAYQWQRDGTDIATGTPYEVTAADVGTTLACVVTATNAAGSTAAPASNGVVVTEPTGGARSGTHRRGR